MRSSNPPRYFPCSSLLRRSSLLATAGRALAVSALLTLGCKDGGSGRDDEGGSNSGLEVESSTSASTTGTATGTTGWDTEVGGTDPADEDALPDGIPSCMPDKLVGVLKPPNVLLVLDKSGSMKTEWDVGNGDTEERWTSLWDTVDFMLENYMQRMNFAVKLFPGEDAEEVGENSCIVDAKIDVPFSSLTKFEILSKIPRKDEYFEGGTPAVTALDLSVDYMRQIKAEDAMMLPQAIILVIDGRVSCDQSTADMQALAASANADNIPIYVVGVDIANDDLDPTLPEDMDALAAAGGTVKHYASNNEAELRAAMELIVGKITECNFPLSEVPINPTLGVMTIGTDPTLIPYIPGIFSCEEALNLGHQTGWVFTSNAHLEVDICGIACDDFAEVGEAKLVFTCPISR